MTIAIKYSTIATELFVARQLQLSFTFPVWLLTHVMLTQVDKSHFILINWRKIDRNFSMYILHISTWGQKYDYRHANTIFTAELL